MSLLTTGKGMLCAVKGSALKVWKDVSVQIESSNTSLFFLEVENDNSKPLMLKKVLIDMCGVKG